MKILQSSIIPAISLISLALAGSLQAMPAYGSAVSDYTGSNNSVTATGTVGSVIGTTSFGLRFTGTGGASTNSNTVVNNGTIFSGTGSSLYSSPIYFDASNGGQSNGNTVKNYGTLIGQNENAYYIGGIIFNSVSNGEANNNTVLNYGTIQVSGSSQYLTGIHFAVTESITCGNYNLLVNNGVITLTGSNVNGGGIMMSAQEGVANDNTLLNNGTISLSGTGYSYMEGMAIDASGGEAIGNTLTNKNTLTVSSMYGIGMAVVGGTVANNTLTNFGNLTVDSSERAYGINVGQASSDITGNTILNSGNLAISSSYDAYGINIAYTDGNITGNTIISSGNFTVSGSNNVYGIYVGNAGGEMRSEFTSAPTGEITGNITGNTLTNSGNFTVSSSDSVYGIYVGNASGNITGNTITNSGKLNVNLVDSTDGYSNGIFLGDAQGDISGNTVINLGNITLSGHGLSGSEYYQDAYGIVIESAGNISGNTLANYGNISVSSHDGGYSYTYGIDFGNASGDISGNTVTNYGNISISGTGNRSFGIFLGSASGNISGNTVLNLGNITINNLRNEASYVRDGSVNAIYLGGANGDLTGNTVTNVGNITVSASGSWNSVGGIFLGYADGEVNRNTITNYGKITVSGGLSSAYGIQLDGGSSDAATGNNITNYGKITVSGDGAYGVWLTSASNTTITNWGTINAASTSGTAYAIYVEGDNNTVTLTGHSSVQGDISATGSNNVLNLAFTGVSAKAKANLIAQLNRIGALSGTASEGTFTFRGVTYTYDPLLVNVSTSSYAEQAKTPNQKAVGASLDSFKVNPTGKMLALLNTLDWSGNVPNGLEQLSPQRYQIYGDIALSNASLLTGLVDQRLNNVRFGSESIDTSALGVSYGSVQSKLGMGSNGLPIVAAKESKEVVTQAPEKRWSAFLSGNVGHASLNDTEDLQNSKYSDSGVIGGVDVKLNDAWTTGLLLGYAHTDAQLDTQGSSADVDAYSAGLYSGYRQGNFYGNGLAAYTYNTYDSGRVVDFSSFSEKANGHTTGSQFTVNLDGGYDQPVTKNISAGPFVGLQYVHLGVDGFNESQAEPANLNINDQAMDSLRSRVGLRVELKKDLSTDWKVASELRAAWQHEFANNDRAIVAQFAGSGLGSFAVRTSDPERDRAVLGIGFNATCRDTLTAFVDYDAEIGSRYTGQIFKGGLKLNF